MLAYDVALKMTAQRATHQPPADRCDNTSQAKQLPNKMIVSKPDESGGSGCLRLLGRLPDVMASHAILHGLKQGSVGLQD